MNHRHPRPRAATRRLHRVAIGALAATAAGGALAQGATSTATTATVIVTASRIDTRLADMPLHTTVITAQEIAQSPARTLDQLLRQVPGLLIPGAPAFTTDPTGHNIKFRGMDKKVLVLVDGVPVLDPFYGTIQWFKVPLSAVERVEIVRGGGSSLWGNLAVGGVINIVSRQPDVGAGELAFGLGSMKTATVAGRGGVALSPALSLGVSADAFRSDGYNNTVPELRAAYWPGRAESSATADNLRLALHFHPGDGLEAFLRAGWHRQNQDVGGYDYGSNLQSGPDAQAGLTQRLGRDGRIEARLYGQRIQFDKYNGAACYAGVSYACGAPVAGSGASAAQQAAPVLQYASSYDLNTYRERGASLVWARPWDDLLRQTSAGLDYREISGEDHQQSYRTPTAALPDVLRIQRANEGAGRQRFVGAFAQFTLRPAEALEVNVSARLDSFVNTDGLATQTSYTNTRPPVALPTTGGAVPGLSKTAFDPSVAARYALADDLDLRGAVYRAFRAPGLNNLYRSFGSNAITIANPLLGPETLVGKEIGIDWRGRGWSAGATLFGADVSDVVATYAITAATPIPDPVKAICGPSYNGTPNAACPGTVSFYTNGQDQRATGIELDGQADLTPTLRLAAYATLTRTWYTRTTTGDPTGVQLSLVPKGVAGGTLSWRSTERWTSNLTIRYNSPMTLSSLTASPALRQGGYTVVDVAATWRVDERVQLNASIVNLGDRRYTDSSASNPQSVMLALPRAVSVGLRAGF